MSAVAEPRRGRALWAWALYDWANSAYFTVIQTFVFAAYFTRRIAPDPTTGAAWWGHAMGAAGLAVALLGPVLGAIADGGARRKGWLAALTALGVLATAALAGAAPGAGGVLAILLAVWVGTASLELAAVVYNAMLPDLAPAGRLGRWSGWGWALGYAGGLVCLLVALVVLRRGADWGLDDGAAAPVRATFLLTAAWIAVFAVPLFVAVPERGARVPARRAVREGLSRLGESVRLLRTRPQLLRFLVARMLYADGLATVFAFGGVYAAGTFGMDEEDVLLFGIGLNVTAGLGAALMARLDDALGPRRTILVSLVGLIVPTAGMLVAPSVTVLWVLGLVLGVFVGPVQASSRSWMARAAPPELRGRMFGLFALSGKATSFLGPLLVGWLTVASGSQRVGLSVVVVLFAAGLVVLLGVREADDVAARAPGGPISEPDGPGPPPPPSAHAPPRG